MDVYGALSACSDVFISRGMLGSYQGFTKYPSVTLRVAPELHSSTKSQRSADDTTDFERSVHPGLYEHSLQRRYHSVGLNV
jgi:hypothetical protein